MRSSARCITLSRKSHEPRFVIATVFLQNTQAVRVVSSKAEEDKQTSREPRDQDGP